MKKLFVTLLAALAVTAQAQQIAGAGATFPAPVYSKWAGDYNRETKVQINYGSLGSAGGIKQLEAKTVDFGATDDPMSAEDLEKRGWHQFPAVIGGVVLVVKAPLATVCFTARRTKNGYICSLNLVWNRLVNLTSDAPTRNQHIGSCLWPVVGKVERQRDCLLYIVES